eukprot:TRINITY_DN7410_c0_g5_i1.p1 TRINITY_DN7410_c0_g5~~TRINITY_DN7410_c0_g5_i1.p1  ORF type:complete len:575 (+),score=184.18 TRINITY_DN7410_c0_g5_i1:35-1759(+)
MCRVWYTLAICVAACGAGGGDETPLLDLAFGEVVEEGTLLANATSQVSPRCAAKHRADYEIAKATVGLPMNAFELFNLCPKDAPEAEASQGSEASGLAVFIMAHECAGLERLIGRLVSGVTVHFVVNMDGSAGSEVDCARGVLAGLRRRHPGVLLELLEEDVEWGSWEMVTAEYRAMEVFLLHRDEHPWGHFLVLSGACYPVTAAADVAAWFKRHPGKSFYYPHALEGAALDWMLVQMTTVCDRNIFHVGMRAAVPPASYFKVANTWKFWDWRFVEWVVAGGADGLFWELLKLLALSLSIDETFWGTLHANSPFCHRVAPIHPREFYTFLWPADAVGRECPARIVNSPAEWYCPKRPFEFTAADVPRLPFIPSLFVRKVKDEKVKDAIDRHADALAAPRALGVQRTMQDIFHTDAPAPVHIRLEKLALQFRVVRDKDGRVVSWRWGALEAQQEFFVGRCAQSGGDAGSEACAEGQRYCRIHVRDAPSLCLSFKDNEVGHGNFLGIAECAPFAEPQLFALSSIPQLQSAAKVSLWQYQSVGGLCVTYDPAASDPLFAASLRACSEGGDTQLIRVA